MTGYKTEIISKSEARKKLLTGVNVVNDAVGSTLGPKGRNVGITKMDFHGKIFDHTILHDGVSVAKAVELEDEFENFGAYVIKEAAQKTVDVAGDGTTVTTILAQSIFDECFKIVETGVNPMSLRKGLEAGRDKLLDELDKYATPIKTLKEEIHIATISAENDELGKLVAETLHKVGTDGVVTVEESKQGDTTVEHQTGLQIDKGWANEVFMTDPATQSAVLEDTYFLVTDMELNALDELGELLKSISQRQAKLVILSPVFGGMTLPLLAQNKLSGSLQVLPVNAPSFGQNQKDILQDIAIVTGARLITKDAAHKFSDVKLSDLGFAQYVTSRKLDTIIVGGKGKQSDIDIRVVGIKKQMDEEDGDFEKEKLRERLGKLTNGVAVIKVGGYTEIEMKERKERVIDAVHSTRAAMQKGIVPGGEIIYLQIRKVLNDSLAEQILFRALEKPFRKLMENADIDAGRMLDKVTDVLGVDVETGQIKDMVKAGIVDPVLVAEQAIYNAVSVATQLATTDTIIIPSKKEQEGKV